MNVVALSASPHKGGNSETLLDHVISGLKDGKASVEKIRTHELDIAPCSGCGACETEGKCCIRDDFQNLRDTLTACDGIIFASPLFFMNVPARGKAVIDRCQVFWIAKHRLGIDLFNGRRRFGMLISCSGARYGPGGSDIFRGIEDTMTYVFDSLGLEKLDSLLFRRFDKPGEIRKNPEALKQARETGIRLAEWGDTSIPGF
ncbi:MAG: flavodoxin family protein [Candidatus Latescibacterota bacterium]|jgi:multimeric flavodoxin WrbA